MRKWLMLTLAFLSSLLIHPTESFGRERWTPEEANAWYARQPWFVGCNFNPSTAINQLEMWQAESFDEPTIDRELKWAQELGFNSIRVYLHNLLWDQDRDGFIDRIDRFLAMADHHVTATLARRDVDLVGLVAVLEFLALHFFKPGHPRLEILGQVHHARVAADEPTDQRRPHAQADDGHRNGSDDPWANCLHLRGRVGSAI